MQEDSFKLILKSKTFEIPFIFNHLIDISKNVSKSLISMHRYEVKSNVSEEVFQSFIGYLTNDAPIDIRIDNIDEYTELSYEFNILHDIIESKKKQFGEHLVNLNNIRKRGKCTDLSFYEELIATRLDEYLIKYGEELMKSPISSLYNIFNHQQRQMTNYNLAYELICRYYEKTKDSNIFVLLDSIDGTKLTKSNLDEAFALSKERLNHMPRMNFTYLSNEVEKNKNLELKLFELMKKFDDYVNKNETEKKNLLNEMNKDKQEYKNAIRKLETKIKALNDQIKEIKTQNQNELTKIVDDTKKQLIESFETRFIQSFTSNQLDLESNGILFNLNKAQINNFDRLFVVSQSSRDIYNLIDPNTKDDFRTSKKRDSFIEFELEEEIQINGVIVFSSFELFPKSFDISVDGNVVKSIENAEELNGKDKQMTIKFDSIKGKKVGFIQKEANWDEGTKSIRLKKFEILSPENRFSKGVFSTLIKKSENHDPHKCPVFITSDCFSFNNFYNIDSSNNIGTYDVINSWFQIEFTRGLVVLDGCRIKKDYYCGIKSFKIIGTDDAKKSEESWIKLIEVNEESRSYVKINIYKFPNRSPPVRFVRFIQTGPNWNDSLYVSFFHFDLFGKYF